MAKDSQSQLERVSVIFNTDYDAELKELSGTDVSAVQEAAAAVAKAVADAGFRSELFGLHGDDLGAHVERWKTDPPDLVFNLVESMRGTTRNEPLFPALLEMFDLAYTGPGPLCLRLCLDKARARQVLVAAGVRVPVGFTVESASDLDLMLNNEREEISVADLVFPYFVKLAREDASIGIEAANVVGDVSELRARVAAMLEQYRQPVVCERYIEGREVNVTVIGNGEGADILPLHEIDFAKMPDGSPHIVSYAAKWDEDHPDYAGTLPVPIRDASPELQAALRQTALDAFAALELRDFARVDLRVDAGGMPYVIDVNPNCDLSPDAGVARAAAHKGLDYPQLIGTICKLAWDRSHGHKRES